MKYDVVIIGAGVVGAMTARELTRYRFSVCLLEAQNDVAMGASRANSGIVHAGFDCIPGSEKARLNLAGSRMMEQIAAELGVPYRKNGSLVIGFRDEDRVALEELKRRGEKNGLTDLKILDATDVHTLEANLSPDVTCALHAPSGAIVSPYALTIAAVGNAMDNGAVLKTCFSVSAIEKQGEDYIIRSEKGETVSAHAVINCAGICSGEIARMIGDTSFTVAPRLGEYLLLDRRCGNTVSHTIFTTPTKMGKGILVSPTADGNLILGPTAVNVGDPTVTPTTAEGLAKISDMAKRMVDGIDLRAIITSFAGLRAVGSTGDFILTSPMHGFLHCAGIESPGLSAAPAIALEVVNALIGMGMKLEHNPDFNPIRPSIHRFAHLSEEEKNREIARDPSYGRIVCRCESVTEGEIREALSRNPKPTDLDGIKRRTRAGMGRCQGGFCAPSVMLLIAEALGIPVEQVTKFGGCSCMAVGQTKEDAR